MRIDISLIVLTLWQQIRLTPAPQVQIYCSGCDNPQCLPSEYRRRRKRDYGVPTCDTITDRSDQKPQLTFLDPPTFVNCTLYTIACKCSHWFDWVLGGGFCAPRQSSTRVKRADYLMLYRTFDVCVLSDLDFSYSYFDWRQRCYERHRCSYPQPYVVDNEGSSKGKRHLFYYNGNVYPGRIGVEGGDMQDVEISKVSQYAFCRGLTKAADPNSTYYEFSSMEMIAPSARPSETSAKVTAQLACTGCDQPDWCTPKDNYANCSYLTNDPVSNPPRWHYTQPQRSITCQMKALKCKCRNWDDELKICKPPRNRSHHRRRRHKHNKRPRRLKRDYWEIGRVDFQHQTLTHNVCQISSEDHAQYPNWETACSNDHKCQYVQPKLLTRTARWIVFYFDGYLLPGLMEAGEGQGYRKHEWTVITRSEFCEAIVSDGFYEFSALEEGS